MRTLYKIENDNNNEFLMKLSSIKRRIKDISSLRKIKKNEKTSKKRRIDTYFLRSLCMVIGVLGLYCIFFI